MPKRELLPGPPCSHTTTGADALLFSAGQCQKKCSACAVALTSKNPAYEVALMPGSGPTLAALRTSPPDCNTGVKCRRPSDADAATTAAAAAQRIDRIAKKEAEGPRKEKQLLGVSWPLCRLQASKKAGKGAEPMIHAKVSVRTRLVPRA